MKLLVMSDSHRSMKHMRYAAEQVEPDVIIHLGDHISDAVELQRRFPNVVFYMVRGNCDGHLAGENELFLTLDGVGIFITHGNIYNVKSGLGSLIKAARDRGADVALYGHTHRAQISEDPGLWLMNPGQMMRHDGSFHASYGILTIVSGEFDCGIEYLPGL